MEIILSKQCLSLTGCLGRGYGYHIQKRKNGFFAKRNTKGDIPRDGHLRFIFLCAELAQNRLYLSDILVPKHELEDALREAGYALTLPPSMGGEGLCPIERPVDGRRTKKRGANASDIINYKRDYLPNMA